MPSPAPKKTGTSKFMRQGHTTGPYGNTPSKDARGEPAAPPKEVKP